MRLAPRQHSSEILDAGLCLDGSAEGLPPARASLRAVLPLGSLVGDVVVAPTSSADAHFGALASPLDAVLTPLALDLEWPPRWAACNRAGSGDALVSVHATFAYAPPAAALAVALEAARYYDFGLNGSACAVASALSLIHI